MGIAVAMAKTTTRIRTSPIASNANYPHDAFARTPNADTSLSPKADWITMPNG